MATKKRKQAKSKRKRAAFEVVESETSWTITQFDVAQCVEGGMEGGETTMSSEIEEGVQAVSCMVGEGEAAAVEVQALVFAKEMFADAAAAEAWAGEHDFATHAVYRRRRLAFRATRKTRGWPCALSTLVAFQEEEEAAGSTEAGTPANPDAPKASESLTAETQALSGQIMAAISAAGWDSMSPDFDPATAEFDFVISEIFTDQVIVRDLLTGDDYKITFTQQEGGVSLGTPEKVEMVFETEAAVSEESDGESSGESADESSETAATSVSGKSGRARLLNTRTQLTRVSTAGESGKRPAYRVLIAASGWTKDGRYIEATTLSDAQEKRLFDNVRCYWQHPSKENRKDGHRPLQPLGWVKAGSAEIIPNDVGGVDLFVNVVLFRNNQGTDIEDILEASVDEGVALIRNSIWAEGQWEVMTKDGRPAKVLTKLWTMSSVDFLDDAAIPRTGVQGRVAASDDNQPNSEELTVSERDELERLRKGKADTSKATHIDTLLAASGLPLIERQRLRIALDGVEDAGRRDKLVTQFAATFASEMGKPPRGGSRGRSDGAVGAGSGGAFDNLSPEVREHVMATAAKINIRNSDGTRGLSEESLRAAADKVEFGTPELESV